MLNCDCRLCLCLNMRRLMLKRRRPKQLTRTRTALEEWGYTNDQEDLNDWRYHIVKELAKDKIIDHDDS